MPNTKKFLLTAVNAKYIHSNLAVRYIKKYAEKAVTSENAPTFHIAEYSINDSINNILKDIHRQNPDVVAFSCYIWNIELILKLCRSLKKIKPQLTILLSGPEVSFDAAGILNTENSIDYILLGEGEETFAELAQYLAGGGEDLSSIRGIAYRSEGTAVTTPERPLIENLDIIPFPYDDMESLNNKIIYYETNRGCPFNCQYCLSSTIHGVRRFSISRIQSDIRFFVEKGIKQVKLVDRTFNCNKKAAVEIMKYIIELGGKTNFHFEIAADLIDDDFLRVVQSAPKDMFQFEIGVQSTNQETLEAIRRVMNFDKVRQNVSALLSYGKTHLHLDLIAGLPFEDYESFRRSFDDVYAVRPHMLQLGFLKLLKGSGIRTRAEEYGIFFHDHAPYEVISTRWLSYGELLRLKDVEHLLEIYYNSGKFRHALEYILARYYDSPFRFYEDFSDYWNFHGYYDSPKGLGELYTILYEFIWENFGISLLFNEYLKLDWLLYGRSGPVPGVLRRYDHGGIKEMVNMYLKNSENLTGPLEQFANMTLKDMLKYISYEVFFVDVTQNPPVEREVLVIFIQNMGKGKEDMTLLSLNLSSLELIDPKSV